MQNLSCSKTNWILYLLRGSSSGVLLSGGIPALIGCKPQIARSLTVTVVSSNSSKKWLTSVFCGQHTANTTAPLVCQYKDKAVVQNEWRMSIKRLIAGSVALSLSLSQYIFMSITTARWRLLTATNSHQLHRNVATGNTTLFQSCEYIKQTQNDARWLGSYEKFITWYCVAAAVFQICCRPRRRRCN
jgi:hypothetical protein